MTDYTPEEMREIAATLAGTISDGVDDAVGALYFAASQLDAKDHLASSGPAGELQEAIERRDHWFARAEEWKNASYKELMKRQAVEYERDTARQECETQKARAIRAEGECQRLREATAESIAVAVWMSAARRDTLGNIESIEFWGADELQHYIKQALTPAPDHAKDKP